MQLRFLTVHRTKFHLRIGYAVPVEYIWISFFPLYTSGTIGHYLKLFEVDAMYFPVPVNFIFIGFEGKGNQGKFNEQLIILTWSHG